MQVTRHLSVMELRTIVLWNISGDSDVGGRRNTLKKH